MGVSTRGGASTTTDETIPRISLFRINSTNESFDSPIDRRSQLYRDAVRQQALSIATRRRRGASSAAPPSPGAGVIDGEVTRRSKTDTVLTLPTILTMLRLVCVPLLVAFWFLDHLHAPVATAALFVMASITDWLDGFLARQMRLTSAFGAFLDPVADKVMISTVLVLLASEPPPPISRQEMVAPVTVMIAREIAMSALREWAAASGSDAHRAVKVSVLGKWKTALQLISLSLLLLLRNDHLIGNSSQATVWLHRAALTSWGVLVVSALLATWSLVRYFQKAWQYFLATQPEGVLSKRTKKALQ